MKKIDIKEKKKYIIRGLILLIIGIIGLILSISSLLNKDTSNKVTDAKKFESEYEKLNNEEKYMKLDIPSDNPMKYVTYEELMDILDNGSGIIYFGFPECPWCRNALPVLLEAAKEEKINEIYYFNAIDMRDVKELDENGNVVTTKEGTEEYKKIVEKLYDYLDVYEGLNDDTIKRLYFPNIFFISNGKVVGHHTSTVSSQEDPSISLTSDQHNELKSIYLENIKKVFNYSCNGGC